MTDEQPKKGFFTKFSSQFWLVVMFEFFERGAYYGMMSFLSQYFVDTLGFPKENVGIIKGVIQPLLYFLPILAGAIADRFGYRKVLMVAFTLLGGGYFLTSQMTSYTAVFAALVIMGFGAGAFKPMISGTIAKITDESNSTQAFGIYYWSINMGAFLFPLILVPILKSINPTYVIIASGICTAAMLIPTALFFKEPTKQKEVEEKAREREKANLIQTLANAFEIIYSPIILLYNAMKKSNAWKVIISIVLILLLGYSVMSYLKEEPAAEKFPSVGIEKGDQTLIFTVNRNMQKEKPYLLKAREKTPGMIDLTIYKPRYIDDFLGDLLKDLGNYPVLQSITEEDIESYITQSDQKLELIFESRPSETADFSIAEVGGNQYKVFLKEPKNYETYRQDLLKALHSKFPVLRGISQNDCDRIYKSLTGRPFFLLFVISLILIGLFIVAVSFNNSKPAAAATGTDAKSSGFRIPTLLVPLVILVIWFLPGLDTLARIICSVIYFSVMSLFIIDKTDAHKFVDHAKFLLMIVLYSGFWVLYFQMFDSVLWYVQAYVDATTLNNAVNSAVNAVLGIFGLKINFFFDVEHVTAINAGTIILLQLIISAIVKKRKAMPTMITGIALGTLGLAILAISTHIWVFMAGIIIFSIGEMTAHPKFISYVGLTAPSDKKAMYMGYIFLYGVFGASVGGIVGAKLYVHFVDNLNQPQTLWLVFASIGVVTILCLLLYNKFLASPKKAKE
jgi:dipeptide/tripeptide permease